MIVIYVARECFQFDDVWHAVGIVGTPPSYAIKDNTDHVLNESQEIKTALNNVSHLTTDGGII